MPFLCYSQIKRF